MLIQETDNPGGKIRLGKRIRRPVAHRAVENQKRQEYKHDRKSEIDNFARELDPLSNHVRALTQQRDRQERELTVKPYMFGQQQEGADTKDGVADPQLPFPQADQQESRRQKYNEVLQRGDQSLYRERGKDKKAAERKGNQFHYVQVLVGSVLKGDAKGRLEKFDHTGGDEDGVKHRDQQPFFFFPHCIPGWYFSELAPVDFREVGKDNQKHHRVFDPVDIGPEYPQKREEPYLVPIEFQDIEKYDDKQVRKKMRPHRQFPGEDHACTGDKQEKAEQQFRPVLMLADKGKTDKQSSQKKEEAPQDDQAVIIRPLKYLVNNNLEKPVVIVPRFGWGNVGKESVSGDCPVLPEIPSSGEVIPHIGIGHLDGPG